MKKVKKKRPALCSMPDCPDPAAYKIAAPWRGGGFSELKEYALSCPDHVAPTLAEARRRSRAYQYQLVEGEEVGEIGVYRLDDGRRDSQLERLKLRL